MGSKQLKDYTPKDPLLSTDALILQPTAGGTMQKVNIDVVQAYMQANLSFSAGDVSSSVQTGNYTILDGDGFTHIFLSGAAANSTFTLPTLADNQDRIITVYNLDSTYELNIDGEGAETIQGMTDIDLPVYGNHLVLMGTSSEWAILDEAVTCQLRLSAYTGVGSTDNKILQFTNVNENVGNVFSENHTTGYNAGTAGLEITANKAGKYLFALTNTNDLGLSLNSTQLTTGIGSITAPDRVAYASVGGGLRNTVTWSGWLSVGDIIRPHVDSNTGTTTTGFTATYLGL